MLLQLQACSSSHSFFSSSFSSYSTTPIPFKPCTLSLSHAQITCPQRSLSVTCAASKTKTRSSNGGTTVGQNRRPVERWLGICKRISLVQQEKEELGAACSASATVLNNWENEGKWVTKWELCRVVKELRKFNRHKRALEVYDWMNNRPERFRESPSDVAIQLDLIAKVHGVSIAEEYFQRLSDKLKIRRTYGALLNVYVHSRLKEKAESLFDIMRSKGFATQSLTFNVMMTLYMNLKDYDKVDMLISDMTKNNIPLDLYSYNIWLSSCGSQGSLEKMEQVFEQMEKDPKVVPNCTTFSTMATIYIKMHLFEKAEECIRNFEDRIEGRDRLPLHYLLSLYGSIGKKDEVYRVWNTYKLNFPSIPNLGYHAVISSLVRMDDIEGAENIYKEWLSAKSSYDPRIGNLLISWYVRKGNTDKALKFYERMTEDGGTPNPSSWELLSMGHIADKKISEALSCLKEALMADGSKSWRPNRANLSAFFELCRDQDDAESAEILTGMLRQSKFAKDEFYASLIGFSDGTIDKGEESNSADRTDGINENESIDSEMLFNQLESSF